MDGNHMLASEKEQDVGFKSSHRLKSGAMRAADLWCNNTLFRVSGQPDPKPHLKTLF